VSYTFISYKREDELRVARIARGLERAGLEIWWDRGLPGGESWHSEIVQKLDNAGCIVAIWSSGSVAPEGYYVRDEARRGLQRGILVPIKIDPIKSLPLGFGEVQAIDLTRWDGSPRDSFFVDLVATVRAKLGGEQPPPLTGPTHRLNRRLIYSAVPFSVIALLVIVAFGSMGGSTTVCGLPGPQQPALSDACGNLHIGGRPSREERLAWASRASGDCAALQSLVNRFPNGARRNEAVALLAARRIGYSDVWVRSTRQIPLLVAPDHVDGPTEAAAEARRLAGTTQQASAMCKAFSASTLFHFVAGNPIAEKWSCAANGRHGFLCGFEGHVDCSMDERHQVEHDTCGPVLQ
jgi:hypothetical protein